MTAYVRALALVLFGVLVLGFVAYVWNLDPDPGPYRPLYPTTTTAGPAVATP